MIKREELSNPDSCMSRARDNEMTFVLLGRDCAAPAAIRAWAERRLEMGKNTADDEQIREALNCACNMEAGLSAGHSPVSESKPPTKEEIAESLFLYDKEGHLKPAAQPPAAGSKPIEQVLENARKAVQPIIDREKEGENITSELMEFRMKGMDQQQTFDWLLERHRKLLAIEEQTAAVRAPEQSPAYLWITTKYPEVREWWSSRLVDEYAAERVAALTKK